MKYLIKVSYDGSKFYGFQRLNNEISVQKVLEDALSKINKEKVEIKGAGRTDRGVHALDQGVSFSLDVDITSFGLKKALNSLIGPYIFVKSVQEVDDSFHARFNVIQKVYRYKINLGEYNPLIADYVYQPTYKVDLKKMKEVANLFLGIHNFKNFVSGERENYECIIYDIKFVETESLLEIIFVGKSFYRYMVRNLVGAMLEVGRNKVALSTIKEMLELKNDLNLVTAPAQGLYLEEVKY